MTHQEIADELGISRSAVQAIEQRALDKFRLGLMARGIRREDLFPLDDKDATVEPRTLTP
jgi:DNA-directed RNA polymerase sigma subunit (sigma70/sigma32)